ncbi:MAG TPA: hypothetical protein VHF23_04995 [Gaiellaceae bacterium]|nr:hypothetical protein [Gaiellaceae bacterium]
MHRQKDRAPGLREVLLVWTVFGAVALAVLVTYARLPPSDLYNVDDDGLAGGAGRALVFLNYPVALAAVAILAVVADRLGTRATSVLAAVAAVLCAAVAWPGVVDQSDLDARPVNAVPAAGVALAAGLTGLALARGGLGARAPRSRWDPVRLVVAGVLVAAALPWLAADLGLSLGGPFLSDEPRPEPGQPQLTAVHLGHHHGLDGTLLALAALALSRVVPQASGRLRPLLGFYVALMLVYGVANALQDFWLEQLVKRGATSLELPSMIRPGLTPAWAAIVAAALVIQLAAGRVGRFGPLRQGGTR